ncbi:MAG TPA: transaldolase [Gemmatimonadaceae bacterium]|nr:transaldolase [Gemmatimonadaceae bacterium]
MSRLHSLRAAGQAVWLDFIDRALLQSGELERRIADDALTGMTSNPTIFEKALAQGSLYDAQIGASTAATPLELFEEIATDDVRSACDVFRSVYDATSGADGFVSIEVSPTVARDAQSTVAEAMRLWSRVDRPNVMIKVPGTTEGVPAVRELIANGVNVNITLLFAVEAHRRVINAYIEGLEARLAAGEDIANVASVASFFVSRVDSTIDARLDALAKAGTIDAVRANALKGRAAIANAKLAYQLARKSFSGARWHALAARGARVQRPLWASTSTKNPAYRDVIYVEQLIGPDTVNTLPPATLDAFRDHGETQRTVDTDLDSAQQLLADLGSAGISLDAVTDQLLTEGLASFQKSFDSLLAGLERKSGALGRALVGAH